MKIAPGVRGTFFITQNSSQKIKSQKAKSSARSKIFLCFIMFRFYINMIK